MNARGSTEVIVATIALSAGAFDRTLYTMVVAMALVTTLAMPPMLRWALSRLPITEEERERLSREAFDEKSFVAGFERLLIAVDESANGQFASRLAGFIAGARGLPTTILHLEPDLSYGLSTPVGPRGVQSEPRATAETLKSTADTAKSLEASSTSGGSPPDAVDVTARVQRAPIEEAVAGEGRKGYDLLVVGIENAVSPTVGSPPGSPPSLRRSRAPCCSLKRAGRTSRIRSSLVSTSSCRPPVRKSRVVRSRLRSRSQDRATAASRRCTYRTRRLLGRTGGSAAHSWP